MSRIPLPFSILAITAASVLIATASAWSPAQSQVSIALSSGVNEKADVLRTVTALAMLPSAEFEKKSVIERVTNTRLQKFGVSPLKRDSTITQVRLQTAEDGSKRVTGLWLTLNPNVKISRDDVLQELASLQSQFKTRSAASDLNAQPHAGGDIISGGEARVLYRRGEQQIAFEFDAKDADDLRFVVFSSLEKNVEPPAVGSSLKEQPMQVHEPKCGAGRTERHTQKTSSGVSRSTPNSPSALKPATHSGTPASNGAAKPAPAADPAKIAPLTGHFTCDNSYQVWVGTEDEVHTLLLEATNMKTVNIAQGEDLPPTTPEPGQYLYIVAWSDDYIYQGLIGAFKGDITILSGDSRWKVLPTGRNKHNKQFPSMKEINNAMEDGSDNWRDPTFGATNGGPPWNFPITGIPQAARWMWYDSNKDRKGKFPSPPYVPFGSGFNHDEFLIFRIPYQDFYSEQLAMSPGTDCVHRPQRINR